MDYIIRQDQVPVVAKYDVVVCGAGPAGWVAATAAARAGCATALIERFGFPGGTATAGLVAPISKFCHNGRRVVGGIAWEFVETMVQAGAAKVELPKGHVSYDPEIYKLFARRMLAEAGVAFYTNAYLCGCRTEGARVTHALFEDKAGTRALSGALFIDCTGDADLCRMAGVPMLPSDGALQPMSMCFLLDGADTDDPLLRDCIHHDGLHGASKNMEIHNYLEGLRAGGADVPRFGGPWFNATLHGNQLLVNITRASADASDPAALSRAETQMREDAFRLMALLRARYPAFENSFIAATATQGGARETRRIRGAHVLTGDEMLRGEPFTDTVALCAHPMDFHSASDNTQRTVELPAPGRIPLRSLLPEGAENLLCAGRCISCDQAAFASLRVQATCMATGEAAGTAAGLIKTGLLKNAGRAGVEALRARLLENGAILT